MSEDKTVSKSRAKRPHVTKKSEETSLPLQTKKDVIIVVGRRKTSVARVRLTSGSGSITVNEKPWNDYFQRFDLSNEVVSPLVLTNLLASTDVTIRVSGGGIRGQAQAVRHGIARALLKRDEELKKTLRSLGFLTRDSRMKERKKPGLKRARRAPQWQKR